MRWLLPLCLAAGVAADLLGLAAPLDRTIGDLRMGAADRPASGEITVVAIDPHSIATLHRWPWPRRLHADLLRRLEAMGADRIALDIDFSSPASPVDDRLLADAAQALGPTRLALPAVRQAQRDRDGSLRWIDVGPFDGLAPSATLTGVGVRPDPDGRIRRLSLWQRWNLQRVPAMPAWLVDRVVDAPPTIAVDFGIDAHSIPVVSLSDVLAGAVEPGLLRHRRILVGATDLTLGDEVSVPRYGALPGVLVQALAAESLLQGRAVGRVDGWPVATIAALVIAGILRAGRRHCAVPIAAVGAAAAATEMTAWLLYLERGPMLGTASVWILSAIVVAGLLVDRARQLARTLIRVTGIARRNGLMMTRIIEGSFDAILTIDENGDLMTVNPAGRAMLALGDDLPLGLSLAALLPDHADDILAAARYERAWTMDTDAKSSDGQRIPVELSLSSTVSGEGRIVIVSMRDASERRAQAAALRHQALHDPLTGLPNRKLLTMRIRQEIDRADVEDGTSLVILHVGIADLADVIGSLGHHAADRLIGEVATRLQGRLGCRDVLARLGGDELAVLLVSPADAAEAAAQAARRALCAPLTIDGVALQPNAAIGIAVFPQHGEHPDALLQHSYLAMQHARHQMRQAGPTGGGVVVYDPARDRRARRHLALTADLHAAVASRCLEVAYQPKIDIARGSMAGVEALARWPHPTRGAIPPDEFVPLAERSGLMPSLTEVILDEALRQNQAWRASGLMVPMAVNIAPSLLAGGALESLLDGCLRRHRMLPDAITLEITESGVMTDAASAKAVLARLVRRGFRISLDDFGTGQSSFAQLRDLPLHEIKLDRSFLLARAARNAADEIIPAMIALAHKLGLRIVVEGVEDAASLAWLREIGCDLAQGYLVAKPMPGSEVPGWLAARLSPMVAAA